MTLIWNGHAWQNEPITLAANKGSYLYGVTAFSATNALAAGFVYGTSTQSSLMARWNGKQWVREKVGTPLGASLNYELIGVGGDSCADAWAVGTAFVVKGQQDPDAFHC
jgi:hypothetical protein